MPTVLQIFWAFVSIVSSVAQAAEAAGDPGWQKTGVEDGVEIFRKEVPGSPLIAFKGEGVVNAPIAKVITILMDNDRATDWIDNLVESKIIRKTPEGGIVKYSHVGTPFVMKDRDFVTLGKVDADPKRKTFAIRFHSIEDPSVPETKFVRGEIMESAFTLKSLSPEKTFVITEIHTDPKGSVSKSFVNSFQKDWPRNTIVALRKQAAKPDVPEDPHYQKLFSSEADTK